MANGKYIGPEDIAEIRATIVQMLAVDTPHSRTRLDHLLHSLVRRAFNGLL